MDNATESATTGPTDSAPAGATDLAARGAPAREKAADFKDGDRQCQQRKNASGKWMNDGRYIEWYPGGAPRLVGEYKDGKRSGKWIEYNPSGKKLSERWFENGVETPTRTSR